MPRTPPPNPAPPPSDEWSDLTINALENLLRSLRVRIPSTDGRLTWTCNRRHAKGTDVHVQMTDRKGTAHHLRIETEQYSSGPGFEEKMERWAGRHAERPNTTTMVISLVMVALSNRLVGPFASNKTIASMVRSTSFRLFPGVGDGSVVDDARAFIIAWVESRV